MPLITGTPFGGGRNSSEGEAAQERRGQEGGRGGGGGIEPEKVFEVSRRRVCVFGQRVPYVLCV